MFFTSSEVRSYYHYRLPNLKQNGAKEWRGACPIHNGDHDSFAVDSATGRWFCHSACGRGGDILDLEANLTGADFPTCKSEVFKLVGRIEPTNAQRTDGIFGHSPGTAPAKPTNTMNEWREVDRYPYVDRNGRLLFEVVRYQKPDGSKAFKQVRPDGHGGSIWNLEGVERVPYRLPRILSAETIYLVEGEKDVHTLEGWGLVASCNPGGSGSSTLYAGWTDHFRGRHIIVLPDNDEPGRKHAAAVVAALLNHAASVRILELPHLQAKGDVTDWRDGGGSFERFRELTEAVAMLDATGLSKLREHWGLVVEPPRAEALAAGELVTRRLSEIEAKPVSWLWPGRIARGKVSIIAGNPGLGKSQITASIAAIVSTGGLWPVDRSRCTPGAVVILSAEDDPADTLRPRLEAADANLDRVHILDAVVAGYACDGAAQQRTFNLDRDLPALSQKLADLGDVTAVVIDPITAYLGNVDSHRNAEVRALLAPLSDLAARHHTAIIGVSHLNKAAGTEALMRVTGSLAFVAAARAAYLVAQDPEDNARRLFLPMKNNIGPDSTGLAFRIEGVTVPSGAGPLDTSKVVWESEAVTVTADEIMRSTANGKDSALGEAEDWLTETLTEPIPASKVYALADSVGMAKRTIQRAAEALGVCKKKAGMKDGWIWSLPPKVSKSPEDVQEGKLDTFGNSWTSSGGRDAMASRYKELTGNDGRATQL